MSKYDPLSNHLKKNSKANYKLSYKEKTIIFNRI